MSASVQAELEDETVGRAPQDPHQPRVQAALVMKGPERGAIACLITATRRAEPEVMVVQVPPRGAARHRAALAVPLDHPVGAARARLAQRAGQQRDLRGPRS